MKTPVPAHPTFASTWSRVSTRFLPFADAATVELPLSRLLRLSLFQVSVGMALALLIGTLNRVMIVELHVPAWLVGFMVALPLVFAPFRALIGFKSDHHKSFLGWKRVPYIWFGSMLQFGGLAIMPFALILLSGDSLQHPIVGQMGAALAFLLVGAGLHTTQTVGLALATDLAPVTADPQYAGAASLDFRLTSASVISSRGNSDSPIGPLMASVRWWCVSADSCAAPTAAVSASTTTPWCCSTLPRNQEVPVFSDLLHVS